ncbi:hypothetical protein K470DRAFT_220076 [Piedraia hortae CBS 480.64]|uniref:Maintenance of telomere capping protein 1 n=1 Tax=Piedraia hortae CBS 480.64 TaxID=1314780 RepID=A0A6A7BUT3_9PEZI|nr:hypothetical protein K470DRAFT_220076 [Piedraia hortae CBS 480.64]
MTGRASNKADLTSGSRPSSVRNSEDKLRSGPTTVRANETTAGAPVQTDSGEGNAKGGGWWGSMFSAASAAVKQAETLAKDIRGNEEAQRWAEQMKGNLSSLQHLGKDLQSRAIPTFTSLLSHIAPPISAHERLQIHITHDIQNYPPLDPLVYSAFSRVMAQVEGGDLMVIQRGSENRSKDDELQGYRGGMLGGASGWTDGPWWREEHAKRQLGTVPGLKEGSRLARVSAESYAKEFLEARGGIEEAAKKATETLSKSNPTRSSDIFLAVQAVSYTADKSLFAGDGRQKAEAAPSGVVEPEETAEDVVAFAIYLHDPIHSICFSTISQSLPQKWVDWIDARPSEGENLPESIQEIINSGGVDPREWVAEWLEGSLSIAIGVVAQKYVARRMGVGEGGLGHGKKRVEEEGVGGEAARAI